MQRYGASPEAWDHFAGELKLTADLLPVVSNPHAQISANSTMKALGKTPSLYNRSRYVVGIPKWAQLEATEHDIQRWKSEPNLGICIQTRSVRAFDIDVADEDKAVAIERAIRDTLGRTLPLRFRRDSGKRLLAFTYHRPLTKHVLQVDGGMVELLATGQQFIAEGTHPSGARYEWLGGLPKSFPVLTGEELDRVKALLETMFGTADWKIARERRKGSGADLAVHDDVADWLVENWETYDVGSDGQVFIECPFAHEHTSDSGDTSTAYFPAGTGGYSRGHFVCLHAHCTGRQDQDFLDETGYNLAQFADLTIIGSTSERDDVGRNASGSAQLGGAGGGDGVGGHGGGTNGASSAPVSTHLQLAGVVADEAEDFDTWPPMVRSKDGKIEPTAGNIRSAVEHGGMILKRVSYDAFTDNLVWAPIDQPRDQAQWRRFTDADMVDVRVELENRGMKPMGKDLLRECVHAAAHINVMDSAVEWLKRLRWDGVDRVERFAIDCWGWKDTPYARAVGRYVWSAMAGRVLQPGVRADMAPILVGLQGIKKTSAIQAMVPHEDMYAEIKLDERDDDLSRKLRGKLVGELEELRGLNSRAIEEIKAFVSRRRESWVPKYKEFENFFWRRCVLIGSTNDDEFLADPTGERRWLPGHCAFIDLERIVDTRDQLWAEGAMLFLMEGVCWRDAEELAKAEHHRFKVGDTWERAIRQWIAAPVDQIGQEGYPLDKGYVTAGEVLSSAIGVQVAHQNKGHELRVRKVMKQMGYRETQVIEGDRTLRAFVG